MPAGTLGLLGFSAVVWVSYVSACRAAAAIGGGSAREWPDTFVHTLVPIALGYVTAHYLTLLILERQRVWLNASDTFNRGWDLFGTDDRQFDAAIVNYPGLIGLAQCAAILAGHVVAVVAAHDRAPLTCRVGPRCSVSSLCSWSWSGTPSLPCSCSSPSSQLDQHWPTS